MHACSGVKSSSRPVNINKGLFVLADLLNVNPQYGYIAILASNKLAPLLTRSVAWLK